MMKATVKARNTKHFSEAFETRLSLLKCGVIHIVTVGSSERQEALCDSCAKQLVHSTSKTNHAECLSEQYRWKGGVDYADHCEVT